MPRIPEWLLFGIDGRIESANGAWLNTQSGAKAPIGQYNTDCPIGYGFYPPASPFALLGQIT